MLNLTNKKNENAKNEYIIKPLSVLELEKFYLKNLTSNLKIGLEYERLSLDKNTLENASYDKIEKIIRHFAQIQNWNLMYDKKTLIGTHDNNGTSISLEPGNQIELSLAPKISILDIKTQGSTIIELLDKIASAYDVIFLGYGITPKSSPDEINLLEKRRYKIMNEYLPNCSKGELCPKMMRQTAGIQINVDYKDKKDAYGKLELFNLISPFIAGLCSNSPIENNKTKEYKSIRNHIWRFSGENRCNLFYKNIFNKKFCRYKDIFKNYINEILDVPMVFIERNDEYIPINGKITFREFMKNGFLNHQATYDDYITHQSLCFPDVRLKSYIEIRNHDSNSFNFALSLCALYKGLCRGNISQLLKELKFLNLKNTDEYFDLASKSGLDFNVGKYSGWDIAEKIFRFAKKNLSQQEAGYLELIGILIETRKTPSDILADNEITNASDLAKFL